MDEQSNNAAITCGNGYQKTVYPILFSVAFAHLLNDFLQIVIPSIYPLLKVNYALSFTQIGLITFVYQILASVLQPIIGHQTDRKPRPFSLVFGMCFTLIGILFLSFASSYATILISVGFVGIGSAIFH